MYLSVTISQLSNFAHVNPFLLPALCSYLEQTLQNLVSSEKRKIKSHLLCLNQTEDREQKHRVRRRADMKTQPAPRKTTFCLRGRTLSHLPEPSPACPSACPLADPVGLPPLAVPNCPRSRRSAAPSPLAPPAGAHRLLRGAPRADSPPRKRRLSPCPALSSCG